MVTVLCFMILALTLILVTMAIKVYLLRKSAKQLRKGIQEHLSAETNTLLSVSTRDKEMRRLTITLNKELQTLRQEQLRYQQGNRELTNAIVNISHDLRTPLTAIFGYLELLKKQNFSSDAARYLERIQNRAQSMNTLTEELFRYSLAHSENHLSLQPVDLRSAVESILLSYYAVLKQRGIEPEITLPNKPVICQLDPSALNRILENILSNILKYSEGDLSVTLEEGGQLIFSNFAPHLSRGTVERLFDRFYTVQSGEVSTGLGLSIAKTLTERMKGRIAATYKKGRLYITVKFTIASDTDS